MREKIRKWLKQFLDGPQKTEIVQIPRFIDASSILTRKNSAYFVGNRRLNPEEVAALRADAKHFKESYLWNLIRRDIHYLAYLQATAKRRTDEDALYAGAMYRDLQIIEEFIETCIRI